jgi:hypothetical protein
MTLAKWCSAPEVRSTEKGHGMRGWIFVLAAAVAACSGRTEAGPIGQPLELRQYLPDSLRSTVASAADSTFRQEIPVGPDSARVEIVWNAFQHGAGRYLTSVSARLIAPAQYDSLRFGNISDLKNTGTKSGPIEGAKAQVAWFKRGTVGPRSGVMNVSFDAAGGRTVGPAGR